MGDAVLFTPGNQLCFPMKDCAVACYIPPDDHSPIHRTICNYLGHTDHKKFVAEIVDVLEVLVQDALYQGWGNFCNNTCKEDKIFGLNQLKQYAKLNNIAKKALFSKESSILYTEYNGKNKGCNRTSTD